MKAIVSRLRLLVLLSYLPVALVAQEVKTPSIAQMNHSLSSLSANDPADFEWDLVNSLMKQGALKYPAEDLKSFKPTGKAAPIDLKNLVESMPELVNIKLRDKLATDDKAPFLFAKGHYAVVSAVDLEKDPKFSGAYAFVKNLKHWDLSDVAILVIEPKADYKLLEAYWLPVDESKVTFSVLELKISANEGPAKGQALGSDSVVGTVNVPDLYLLREKYLKKIFGSSQVILVTQALYNDETEEGAKLRNATLVRALSLRNQTQLQRRKEKMPSTPGFTEDAINTYTQLALESIKPMLETPQNKAAISEMAKGGNVSFEEAMRLFETQYKQELNLVMHESQPKIWEAECDQARYYRSVGIDHERLRQGIGARLQKAFVAQGRMMRLKLTMKDATATMPIPVPYYPDYLAYLAFDAVQKE